MQDYSSAWRRHRFLKRLPMLMFLAGVLLIIATGQIQALRSLQPLLPIVGVAYVVSMIVLNLKLMRFACPRCKKRFNGNAFRGPAPYRKTLGRECGHCGLALYE
jgi:hypothetical protein